VAVGITFLFSDWREMGMGYWKGESRR